MPAGRGGFEQTYHQESHIKQPPPLGKVVAVVGIFKPIDYFCLKPITLNLNKYQLKSEETLTVFEFTSIGKKGQIPKIIKFSETHLKGIYNLGFGDKNLQTGELDDLAVSDNGDSEKILITVVSAVYAFTDRYPQTWVYATGSTPSRIRMYRMGITKYFNEASVDFEIYGQTNDEWVQFQKGIEFEAFIVRRKEK